MSAASWTLRYQEPAIRSIPEPGSAEAKADAQVFEQKFSELESRLEIVNKEIEVLKREQSSGGDGDTDTQSPGAD